MNRKILIFGRCVFFGGFLVAVFGLFFLEIWELKKNRKLEMGSVAGVLTVIDGEEVKMGESSSFEDEAEIAVGKVEPADARPVLIKKYLEKYKSPLVPYSDLIFELSQTYSFEYYWMVAIAQQESNLCKKIPENSYNCWGYGIHKKGTLRFESYEVALKSYAEYLKREYFDKGLNTPELIMKKYCPHSNGSWAYGVRHFIEDIEKGI